MTLTGTLSFLEASGDSSDVSWLVVVQNSDATPPEVEVRRFSGSAEKLDTRHGRLQLVEANEGGGSAQGSGGFVRLTLTGTPVQRGNGFVWELLLKARPGLASTRFVLGGQIPDGGPQPAPPAGQPPAALPALPALAEVSATSLARAQLNATSLVVQRLQLRPIPRLSVGLNQATPPKPVVPYRGMRPTGTAEDALLGDTSAIAALLYRIFVLLDSPGTLDPVWDQQSQARSADLLAKERFRTDPVRTAEELWARQVAEMLCFVPYGGPAAQYGISRDNDLMTDGVRANASNPRYGLAYACQHLANFGVVSRGMQDLPGGTQLNAGSTCAATVSRMGGTWFTGDVDNPQPVASPTGNPADLGAGPLEPDLRRTVAAIADYGPGAVHLFANRPVRRNEPTRYAELNRRFAEGAGVNGKASAIVEIADEKGRSVVRELTVDIDVNRDPPRKHSAFLVRADRAFLRDNQDDPHLGFVLRVRKSLTDPAENRIQTLDTGGFAVTGRGNGVSILSATPGFHTGIFDDPPTTTIRSGKHPFRGTGVFPLLTSSSAPALETHVRNVLQKARPLGLARLVLLKRSATGPVNTLMAGGGIVYASPLLTMYLNESGAESDRSNYSISRYAWSLRDLPGRQDLLAMWMLYLPIGALASEMISRPRTDSATALGRSVTKPNESVAEALFRQTSPIADIVARPDGSVQILGKAAKGTAHPLHRLEQPAAGRGSAIPLPMDQAFPPQISSEASIPPYFRGA